MSEFVSVAVVFLAFWAVSAGCALGLVLPLPPRPAARSGADALAPLPAETQRPAGRTDEELRLGALIALVAIAWLLSEGRKR